MSKTINGRTRRRGRRIEAVVLMVLGLNAVVAVLLAVVHRPTSLGGLTALFCFGFLLGSAWRARSLAWTDMTILRWRRSLGKVERQREWWRGVAEEERKTRLIADEHRRMVRRQKYGEN